MSVQNFPKIQKGAITRLAISYDTLTHSATGRIGRTNRSHSITNCCGSFLLQRKARESEYTMSIFLYAEASIRQENLSARKTGLQGRALADVTPCDAADRTSCQGRASIPGKSDNRLNCLLRPIYKCRQVNHTYPVLNILACIISPRKYS